MKISNDLATYCIAVIGMVTCMGITMFIVTAIMRGRNE